MSKKMIYTKAIATRELPDDYNEDKERIIIVAKELVPNDYFSCLVVPEISNENRPRELVECASNFYQEITESLSVNRGIFDGLTNEQGLDLDFVFALKALGNCIQYISNCTSLYSSQLYTFDKIEIVNRLEFVISTLEHSAIRRKEEDQNGI